LKLKVDKGATFIAATEHHGKDVTQSALRVEGWVTESQVALEEGLQNYTSNPEKQQMLMDILEGLPSKPHEWPNLAATCYKQYAYSAKQLKEATDIHNNGITYQALAEVDKGNAFASLAAQLGNQVSMKSKPMHNKAGKTRENQVIV